MKLAAYLLTALLLSVDVAAQDTAKQSPPKDKASPEASRVRRAPLNGEELAPAETENNTCYTIRAYLFERSQTTDTPRPAGMMTCVPHNPRALKKIQKVPRKSEPRVRVVY